MISCCSNKIQSFIVIQGILITFLPVSMTAFIMFLVVMFDKILAWPWIEIQWQCKINSLTGCEIMLFVSNPIIDLFDVILSWVDGS